MTCHFPDLADYVLVALLVGGFFGLLGAIGTTIVIEGSDYSLRHKVRAALATALLTLMFVAVGVWFVYRAGIYDYGRCIRMERAK